MIRSRLTTMCCQAAVCAFFFLSGCAYTSVTVKNRPPKPGPPVSTHRKALMPDATDLRRWPTVDDDRPIEHVRLFRREISQALRQQLVDQGLFDALIAPDAAPGGLDAQLILKISGFKLASTGKNSWVLPHLILDGLVLPLFALVNIGTGGEADLGAYVFTSTQMGVSLQATATYKLKGLGRPVLQRSYLVEVPLEAVSQFSLRQELFRGSSYGVRAGLNPGRRAVVKLAGSMTRDPHWALLDEYTRLARAGEVLATAQTPASKIRAARELIPLIKPLAYAPDEARVLRDAFLSPDKRAAIVNDLRAQAAGLSSASGLPLERRLDQNQAKKLFDEPAVERALVQARLIEKVFALILQAMTPAQPQKKKPFVEEIQRGKVKAAARPGPASPRPREASFAEATEAKLPAFSPQDQELLASLRGDLAKSLKGRHRLQAILLSQADLAVGWAWPPAEALLKEIGGPAAEAYLRTRAAK